MAYKTINREHLESIVNNNETKNINETMDKSSQNCLEKTKSKYSEQNFYDLMRYERLRLVTYLLFGHQWPKMDIISPSKLASAGFFYFKNDSVKCAFCRIILSDWKEADDPMEEHRKFSSNCDFFDWNSKNVPLSCDPDLNSETVENSFTSPTFVTNSSANQQQQTQSSYNETNSPRYAMWSNRENRARSFQSKLWASPVNARKLYDAGFFFTGKDDRTRCFHCGGMLYQWNKNEDPMEEHARYFPNCYFLHTIKGKTFVEFVQFKTQIIQLREKLSTPPEITKRDIDAMKSITYQNFLNMKQSASKLFKKLETTPEDRDTSDYYQRYLRKFFFLMDCQVLFQHLVSMEVMEPRRGILERAASPISDIGYSSDGNETSSSVGLGVTALTNTSIFSFDDGVDSDDSNLSIKSSSSDDDDDCNEESENSKRDIGNGNNHRNDGNELIQCIICCENDIEVVFIPCGHQLACRGCSMKFEKCPVCRKGIREKVRTFFMNSSPRS